MERCRCRLRTSDLDRPPRFSAILPSPPSCLIFCHTKEPNDFLCTTTMAYDEKAALVPACRNSSDLQIVTHEGEVQSC